MQTIYDGIFRHSLSPLSRGDASRKRRDRLPRGPAKTRILILAGLRVSETANSGDGVTAGFALVQRGEIPDAMDGFI